MITLPADICLHIAAFMDRKDLSKMIGVNSIFLRLVLNMKYHYIMFTDFGDAQQLRLMRRVSDPYVAYHVRDLIVHADFDKSSSKISCQYVRGNMDAYLAVDEAIQAMTETITSMTNITSFSIHKWSSATPSVEHLQPFLTAAWKTIASNVQTIEITASPLYMPGLISTAMACSFMKLRKLNCEIYNSYSGDTPGPGKNPPLANILASFINKVAPTLCSLSLETWKENLEFPALFRQLGNHIPNLEKLTIRDCCHSIYVLENPVWLTRFLHHHAATLRSFRWKKRFSTDKFVAKDGRSGNDLLMDWLCGNELDEIFGNLRKLEFPVPLGDAGSDLMIRHIQCSAQTLTSLRLWNGYLSYDKVESVVSLFSPSMNLRELGLWVDFLSPEVLRLLARALPHLKQLSIQILFAAGGKDDAETWYGHAVEWDEYGYTLLSNDAEEFSSAQRFVSKMRNHGHYWFQDWWLEYINISTSSDRDHRDLSSMLTMCAQECIPSLRG